MGKKPLMWPIKCKEAISKVTNLVTSHLTWCYKRYYYYLLAISNG